MIMNGGFQSLSGKACDACRRRKLKCSSIDKTTNTPEERDRRCTRCINTGLRCTYNDEHGKRGPKTGKRLKALREAQQIHAISDSRRPGVTEEYISNPSLHRDPIGEESSPSNSDPGTCRTLNAEAIQQTLSQVSNIEDNNLIVPVDGTDVFSATDNVHAVGFRQSLNGDPLFLSSQLVSIQDAGNNLPFSVEFLLRQIEIFFSQGYLVYPVLRYNVIMNRILEHRYKFDLEFRGLLLSIILLNEACEVRKTPERGVGLLKSLVRSIEVSRNNPNGYHFADNPSIDSVIISLFLFIAYNVSELQNRAFCYLTEAIGLFDLLDDPSDPEESIRFRRLEFVLYNTEAASIAIYGTQRKRMISRRPSDLPLSARPLLWHVPLQEVEGEREGFHQPSTNKIDKQATELLLLMTRLHLANNLTEVASITSDDWLIATAADGPDANSWAQIPKNSRFTTQTADVAITRQWKLASFWWNRISSHSVPASSIPMFNATAEMIATSALTWSKILQPGHLRIVGLGKVVRLTESIVNISLRLGTTGSSISLIRSLIQTVAETDYDRQFAPQLSMTELCIGDIPRPIMSNEDFEQFLNDINEDCQ